MPKKNFRFAARKIADWMIEGGKDYAFYQTIKAVKSKRYSERTREAFMTSWGM